MTRMAIDRRLEQIVFNWRNQADNLAEEDVRTFEATLSETDRTSWDALMADPKEAGSRKWHAARSMFLLRSLTEAKRLGFSPHSEERFTHEPIVLIEMAIGESNGIELAKQWGFQLRPTEPASMWEVMAYRVDGDAVIGLIGDDRGFPDNWIYFVAVAWAPQWARNEYGPTYTLH